MEWTQVLTIVGSNIALIIVMFSISIGLYLHTDKKIDAIHQEIKDFHGKLCAIEERNRKE